MNIKCVTKTQIDFQADEKLFDKIWDFDNEL